jgi:hypothetical protein
MIEESKPKVVEAEPLLPVRLTKEGKPFREQVRDKIKNLPDDVHEELDRRLDSKKYSLRFLSEWLEEDHGVQIGPTSLHGYQRLRNMNLIAVKRATEEARQIVALAGGDNSEINRVLTMLAQTKIYEMLVQMNTVIEAFDQVDKANNEAIKRTRTRKKKQPKGGSSETESEDDLTTERPNKAALAAVSLMVKNTTAIGQHVIETDKWDIEREIRLAQLVKIADEKVCKIASEAGLSPEVEKTIRDALMEIKV